MWEALMAWAGRPDTAWWVLYVGAAAFVVEVIRLGRRGLWADMMEEDPEDEA